MTRRWKFLLVFSLALLLTGCLGGSPSGTGPGGGPVPTPRGHIVGRVINETGDGVFGALVTLDQPAAAAKTDSQGRYTLSNVPVGTYKIVVEMPGHAAAKAPNAADYMPGSLTTLDHDAWAIHALNVASQAMSDVQVTVIANQTVAADDIILYPEPNTVDNVGIAAVDPDVTTTFTAGSQVDLELGIFYSLQSAPEAALVVATGYGDVLLAGEVVYVTEGSGTANVSLSLDVPHAPFLTLHALLISPNLIPLAETVQLGHAISNVLAPQAPALEVGGHNIDGIRLQWSGGTIVNFAQYRLYRELRNRNPSHTSSTLIATITDPTITTFLDDTITLGDTYRYRLYLETLDGQLLPSNSVTVEDAGLIINDIFFVDPYPINNLVADPVRDRLYVISRFPWEITQISTQSDLIERVIPLDCQPGNSTITPDGSYLFLTCPTANTLIRVSLAGASQVHYFADVGTPLNLAVDSLSRNLYVSDEADPIITVYDITNMTKMRTETIDFTAHFLVISPNDALLIAANQPYGPRDVPHIQTYSTTDFAPDVGWAGADYLEREQRPLTVHPTLNKVYFGDKVFNLDTGTKEETLTVPVWAVSQSGKYIYGGGIRGSQRFVVLFSWNGLTWTEHLLIGYSFSNAGIAVTPDDAKLYFVNNNGVRAIDLRFLNLH